MANKKALTPEEIKQNILNGLCSFSGAIGRPLISLPLPTGNRESLHPEILTEADLACRLAHHLETAFGEGFFAKREMKVYKSGWVDISIHENPKMVPGGLIIYKDDQEFLDDCYATLELKYLQIRNHEQKGSAFVLKLLADCEKDFEKINDRIIDPSVGHFVALFVEAFAYDYPNSIDKNAFLSSLLTGIKLFKPISGQFAISFDQTTCNGRNAFVLFHAQC